jgi:hypothetical protein
VPEYFPVNAGTQYGAKLKKFRDDLRALVDLGRDLQGKANATVIAGPPEDFSQVESVFGLSPIASATGTDMAGYKVKFQLDSVMSRLDNDAQQNNAKSVIQQFLDQVA